MSRDNLEHGWLVGKYGERYKKEPICLCEWCDEEIYFEEDLYKVNGCLICAECKRNRDLENEEVW